MPVRCLLLLLLLICSLPLSIRAEMLELEIDCPDPAVRDILERALQLPRDRADAGQISPLWLRNYRSELPERVATVLQPYGYFHTATTTRLVTADNDGRVLRVSVAPGEPLRVTSLQLELVGEAGQDPQISTLLEDFPLKIGDILRQDHYDRGKAVLRQRLIERGFLDASYQRHQIRVDRDNRLADISLILDSGPLYRFGETRFEERGEYPRRFLQRFLAYAPGHAFSHEQLAQTRLRLLNSDQFAQVEIRPLREQAVDRRVPVRVDLSPQPAHRLRPGIGYGTDTGARVTLESRHLNLFERAHELKSTLLIAEREQNLALTYSIPDLRRLDSQTLLRLGYNREDTESYESRELFAEAEYQRQFTTKLTGSGFVRLTRETTRIGSETNSSGMVVPGLRLLWQDFSDSPRPERGRSIELQVQGTHPALLADVGVLQLSAAAAQLTPLPGGFSLFTRLRGGISWLTDPLDELPASLRFFAGGDQSVRGYAYHSLGPTNAEGEVVGGKHLLALNLELEKAVSDHWGAAVFYDIGNAFNSLREYDLYQGVGVGLRRYTRIGALRLDLARRVGPGDGGYRVHVSIGFGW